MLMVDDVNMYIPFLHPSVVSQVNKVFCVIQSCITHTRHTTQPIQHNQEVI